MVFRFILCFFQQDCLTALARQVEHCHSIVHQRSRRGQHLAAGAIEVAGIGVDEVVAREGGAIDREVCR